MQNRFLWWWTIGQPQHSKSQDLSSYIMLLGAVTSTSHTTNTATSLLFSLDIKTLPPLRSSSSYASAKSGHSAQSRGACHCWKPAVDTSTMCVLPSWWWTSSSALSTSINRGLQAAAAILRLHRYHILLRNFHIFNTAMLSCVCGLSFQRNWIKLLKYKLHLLH